MWYGTALLRTMNTKDKGDLAEISVIKRLKEKGYTVLDPFGDNAPYDLVYDDGNSLIKVQVKFGTFTNGSVKARLDRTHRCDGDTVHSSYSSSEIDEYAIYCQDTNSVYMVSIEDAPKTEIRLRVEDAKIDSGNIRWAKEYKL